MSKQLSSSNLNCPKHNEDFKLYCQEDEVPVCVICIVAGRHKNHSVVTLNEMLQLAKSTLEVQAGELRKRKSLIHITVKSIANNITEVNNAASGLQKQISQKYKDMIVALKKTEDEALSSVKAEQKKIIKSLNEKANNCEKEGQEVQTLIEQISYLLQDGDIYKILQDKADIKSRAQLILEKPIPRITIIQLDDTVPFVKDPAITPETKLKSFLIKKWARNISLDVETANSALEISDDRKSVSFSETAQGVPSSPKRFTHMTNVLGSEGFSSGKHYWEVIVQDHTDWSVGVVYQSIPRDDDDSLTNSPMAWLLVFDRSQYMVWHNNVSMPLNVDRLERLGVLLDYEGGQLAFYNVDTMTLLHTFSELFTDTLYPAFNPGKSSDRRKNPALILWDSANVQ